MYLSLLANWSFLYQNFWEVHWFYQSLHRSGLPRFNPSFFIGGLLNSQLCCVPGAVFVLELPFWLHWLYTIAFSPEKVKYFIIEKTQSSFVPPTPRVWHPVAVLVWLVVTFLTASAVFCQILNRFKVEIVCVTAGCRLAPAWDFKPICIPGVVRIKYLFFYLESLWYYWIGKLLSSMNK